MADLGEQHAILDVHALLISEDWVLLSQRRGPYAHGQWHLPSGKIQPGESCDQAVIRETHEEVGVTVRPTHMRCVHTMHVQYRHETPRIGFFYEVRRWDGEPNNREPDKCITLRWVKLAELPEPMIPYPGAGIRAYLAGIPVGRFGWGSGSFVPLSPPTQPRAPLPQRHRSDNG